MLTLNFVQLSLIETLFSKLFLLPIFKGLSLTMQSVCTNASAHARIDGMFKNEIQYETNYKMNKKLECMSKRSKSSYWLREYTMKLWYLWSRISSLKNCRCWNLKLLRRDKNIVFFTSEDKNVCWPTKNCNVL